MTDERYSGLPERSEAKGRGRRLEGRALIAVFSALMLTLLLEALDQTVVGTALPRIIGSLQGFDRYVWTVIAYSLASTTMLPIVGKLSDQFGRKWFLIVGTATFLLGSALAGAAQTMAQLIAFRAVQGLGAGTGIALIFTVVADIFPPGERVKWQSALGVVYGFSSVAGPAVGGWLADHGPLIANLVTETSRWRWVFYVNLPLGVLALVVILLYLPRDISVIGNRHAGWEALRRIDFPGGLLGTGATVCLLLGLTWGSNRTHDWSSLQVLGLLTAAGLQYGLFFLAERAAVEPILPLDLFRNRVVSASAALSLLHLMVVAGLVVYLPLFLQGVLGQSATDAGAVIIPLTASSVIGATLAGFLVATLKGYQKVVVAGSLIMTAGVFLLTRMTMATGLAEAAVFMVVAGLGLGPFFSVLTIATQNALPVSRLGVGTAAIRYVGQLGAVFGTALVGAVVNHSFAGNMAKGLPAGAGQLPGEVMRLASDPQVLVSPANHDAVLRVAASAGQQDLVSQVFEAVKASLATGIHHGLVAVLVCCGVAIVATLFLKDVPVGGETVVESESGGARVTIEIAER